MSISSIKYGGRVYKTIRHYGNPGKYYSHSTIEGITIENNITFGVGIQTEDYIFLHINHKDGSIHCKVCRLDKLVQGKIVMVDPRVMLNRFIGRRDEGKALFRLQDAILLQMPLDFPSCFTYNGKKWFIYSSKFRPGFFLCEDGQHFTYGMCTYVCAMGDNVAILSQYGGYGWGDSSYHVADFGTLMDSTVETKHYKFPLDDMFIDSSAELRFEGDDVIHFEYTDHVLKNGKICYEDNCEICDRPIKEKHTLVYSVTMRRKDDEYFVERVFIDDEICRQNLDDADIEIFYEILCEMRSGLK